MRTVRRGLDTQELKFHKAYPRTLMCQGLFFYILYSVFSLNFKPQTRNPKLSYPDGGEK